MNDLLTRHAATLSPCERYRYSLSRSWGTGPLMGFVMLNPSTADAEMDDPTIRRCLGFARREGAGGIMVGNLFAWRSTSPAALYRTADIIGPRNDTTLRDIATTARVNGAPVVCAWGAHEAARTRATRVLSLLRDQGAILMCLGMTRDGSPRHPLYVRGDQPLVAFA